MERATYAQPVPPALTRLADPTIIDDSDAEAYIGRLFTDHYVRSSGDAKIKDFCIGADECLKKVTARRRGFKIDSILILIAVLLLWLGFAKADDFSTGSIIVYIGLIFLIIGGVRMHNHLGEEKPGELVYKIAAAWEEALPKFHAVGIVNQFGNTLRGRGSFRRILYGVNKDTTTILGIAFDARLRHFRDELRNAETEQHRKKKAVARDMFARTDKAAQLLGFAPTDWKILSE